MKPAAVRISSVLALIAIIAVDCGWLRTIFTGRGSVLGLGGGEGGVLDLGVLAMLNILGLGLLAPRDQRGAFLTGFEVAGVLAIVIYVGCCRLFPDSFAFDIISMGIIQRIHNSFMEGLPAWMPGFARDTPYPPFILVPLALIYTLVLALPLLLVAVAGGFVSRRMASGPTA